uniref:Sulfotransferase n=1 Tax=Ciona savignyi TaxID=51511 RepID=H2Z405_CIOSA
MSVSEDLRKFYSKMVTEVTDLVLHPDDLGNKVNDLVEDVIASEVHPEIDEWMGRQFFPGFRAKTAEFCFENWSPKKGDVLVASFMKTGTHWVREIVRQLFYQHDKELVDVTKKIGFFFAYLESGLPCKFDVVDDLPFPRRIFGSHMPAELINVEKYVANGVKIIYVYRNPKDQLVSFFHFMQSMQFQDTQKWQQIFPSNWNKFYDSFTNGEQPIGLEKGQTYVDHILSWYKHYNNDSVLFVKYEDLKKDPHSMISRIANFAEVDVTKDDVTAIVENTSFKKMKENADKEETAAQSGEKMLTIFRNGKTGGWKDYFTVAQSEKMDRMFQKLDGTDIFFNYE